jgi:hypothetical protein
MLADRREKVPSPQPEEKHGFFGELTRVVQGCHEEFEVRGIRGGENMFVIVFFN